MANRKEVDNLTGRFRKALQEGRMESANSYLDEMSEKMGELHDSRASTQFTVDVRHCSQVEGYTDADEFVARFTSHSDMEDGENPTNTYMVRKDPQSALIAFAESHVEQ